MLGLRMPLRVSGSMNATTVVRHCRYWTSSRHLLSIILVDEKEKEEVVFEEKLGEKYGEGSNY